MIPMSDIHIFIPAFNEEQTIGAVLAAIQKDGYASYFVINDGSTDQTAEQARLGEAGVIDHWINRGVGAATQTAIEFARSKDCAFMVLMDGDGQHLAQDIEVLAKRMAKGDCDIVIGSRFLKDVSAMPRSRRGFNYLANVLTHLFSKHQYTDTQSGFRMLNRRAIEHLELTVDQFGFCSEMLFLAEQKELRVVEVPITTVYTPYSLAKGQDFYTGIATALHFIWRIIFR